MAQRAQAELGPSTEAPTMASCEPRPRRSTRERTRRSRASGSSPGGSLVQAPATVLGLYQSACLEQ